MKFIYISGPMRGYPDSNRELFDRVAEEYRAMGHAVYCPTQWVHPRGEEFGFDMRAAFKDYAAWICDHAQVIVMLPGWEASMGATIEHNLARNVNCEVIYYGASETPVLKDLAATLQARSVRAYLDTYLHAWEAGGCVAHPEIMVQWIVGSEYRIDVTHREVKDHGT